MTEDRRTKFLKALVFIMPEETIDDMWEYAKLKPARRKAWNAAKNAKTAPHCAEHIANMKAAHGKQHNEFSSMLARFNALLPPLLSHLLHSQRVLDLVEELFFFLALAIAG
eukprot:6272191-Karenia_brevis.AAC.1